MPPNTSAARSATAWRETGAVVLTLDAADGGNPEAYRLDITPEYIRIGGSTYGGVFNGVQQLFRLLPPEVYARKASPRERRSPARRSKTSRVSPTAE